MGESATPFPFQALLPDDAPAVVLSVQWRSQFVLRWTFDKAVTLATPPQPRLRTWDLDDEIMVAPASTNQVSPAVIDATYGVSVTIGEAWDVESGTVGLAPGTPVAVPENGLEVA